MIGQAGDVIIDGGCDSISECDRRCKEVEEKGFQYMTMAILGTENDMHTGPAFVASGTKSVYDLVEPMLNKVAAEANHHACAGYIGKGSAAVFVKSLCDALEIGESQLLAETYDLMRQMRLSNNEMGDTYAEWNKRDQASYLLQITSTIVSKKDTDVEGGKPSDNFLVERIWDQAPQKKSGVEVMGESATIHSSGSVIDSAIFARYSTCSREQRVKGRCDEGA